MFCPNCNSTIPDGSAFCTYCGAPIYVQPQQFQYQPQFQPPQQTWGQLAQEQPQQTWEQPAQEQPQQTWEQPAQEQPQQTWEQPAQEQPQQTWGQPAQEQPSFNPALSTTSNQGMNFDFATNTATTEQRYEYKVLSQKDKWFSGKFDPMLLEQAMNAYAQQGWRVVGCATADIAGFGASRQEFVTILERKL